MFRASLAKLNEILIKLEKEIGIPNSSFSESQMTVPKQIKCTRCEYFLTLPFEEKCPLCGFKDKSKLKVQFKNLDMNVIKSFRGMAKTSDDKQDAKKQKTGKTPEEEFDDVHLSVSKIMSIKRHPEADKLFVCEVDVGGSIRSVCCGLVFAYREEDLNGKLVVTLLNLKPKKLKGVESAAMILAAENEGKAQILVPPHNSTPGDRIFLEGTKPRDPAKVLSTNTWTSVSAGLKVLNSRACFLNKVLRSEKGEVLVPDMPDNATIK